MTGALPRPARRLAAHAEARGLYVSTGHNLRPIPSLGVHYHEVIVTVTNNGLPGVGWQHGEVGVVWHREDGARRWARSVAYAIGAGGNRKLRTARAIRAAVDAIPT